MKFANSKSNENERDVNYLTASAKKKIKTLNTSAATQFNEYIADEYDSLVNELKHKNVYDEDTFILTYMKLYDIQLYKASINDYRSYFIRSYYTNYFQKNIKESKHNQTLISLSPDDGYNNDKNLYTDESFNVKDTYVDNTEFDNEEENELNQSINVLYSATTATVYSSFTLQEFSIFNIYFSMKPYISYKKLADITKIPQKQIADTICRIKKFLATKNELKNNRNKITYKQ